MGQATATNATTWTEDVIARLRALWTEGMSTNAIGRSLGVSKNAIVGKAHRMGLPARPSPIVRDGRVRPPSRRLRPLVPSLTDLQTATDMLAAASGTRSTALLGQTRENKHTEPDLMTRRSTRTVANAEPMATTQSTPTANSPAITVGPPRRHAKANRCCWPIGEPGTRSFQFCDQSAPMGKPYCEEHTRRAYARTERATSRSGNAARD